MSKKGIGVSIGLASALAVGTIATSVAMPKAIPDQVTEDTNKTETESQNIGKSDIIDKATSPNKSTSRPKTDTREKDNKLELLKEIRSEELAMVNKNSSDEKTSASSVLLADKSISSLKNETVKLDKEDTKADKKEDKKDENLNLKANKKEETTSNNKKTTEIKTKDYVYKEWVQTEYDSEKVKEDKATSSSEKVTMYASSPVYIRADKSIKSDKLGLVEKNKEVSGLVVGEWLQVDNNGKNGYISTLYLQTERKEKPPKDVNKDVKKEDKKEETKASKNPENEKTDNKKIQEDKKEFKGEKYTGFVTEALNVRNKPSMDSDIIKVYPANTKVEGIKADGWIQVKGGNDTFYISSKYVSDKKPEEKSQEKASSESKKENTTSFKGVEYTGFVSSPVNVRDNPSMNSNVIKVYPRGHQLTGLKGNGWIQVKEGSSTFYVSSNLVQDEKPQEEVITEKAYKEEVTNNSGANSDIVSAAMAQLGKPYVYGSAGPSAFDCSGLTSYLYQNVYGISLNRNSAAQASNGYAVDWSNLQEGDLMFFNTSGSGISHVGIYVGGGQMVHASTPSTGVICSNINADYYVNTFVTARRIVN